jgi:hypothetical protein
MIESKVVQLSDHQPPIKSQYERYPLPFFAADRFSTWTVKPTGRYFEDCQTGKAYAVEFLKSCDGTVGWSSLLAAIVGDMIGAGPSGTFADGTAKIDGVVVGFMNTIGKALIVDWGANTIGKALIDYLEE